MSRGAPLVLLQVYSVALTGSCRLMAPRALDFVEPVLFWSAALRGPAVPISLVYLALCTLPQLITFLKVMFADSRPM